MEALDLCTKTAADAGYLIFYHPLLSFFGSIALLICMIHFYCRLTVGIYEGDEDMTGKTVIITGASAGIGKATAFDLAKRNARVIMACRNLTKAQRVADEIVSATGNKNVVIKCLDLCSFDSVRRCASDILKTEEKVHVLINNAGISIAGSKSTLDGYEPIMQSNHLGHFLFTLLLINLLKKSAPSRIINVSSAVHAFAKLDLGNLQVDGTEVQQYAITKLANVLFTVELAKRLAGTGVTVNSLHPGCVKSDIMSRSSGSFYWISYFIFNFFGKSTEEGAQTSIRLAVDPQLETTTGRYFSDCKEHSPKGYVKREDGLLVDLAKEGLQESAEKLFQLTETTVGISFPEPRIDEQ